MPTPPAIVLVNPQLGENIGTAARAMANFSLQDLRIVEPRDGWPNKKAVRAAAKGAPIVEAAHVYGDLAAALADVHHVYATTARPRDMIKPVMTPFEAAADMHRRTQAGEKCAVLFGRERWGLQNDEIALADEIIMAPVNPDYASLNIAQAVLLIGYEWYRPIATTLGQQTGEAPAVTGTGLKTPGTRAATRRELVGLFEHLESELDRAGYFKSANIRPRMVVNLRNMLGRAGLTEQEVRTLRGVIASLVRAHLRHRDNDG